MTAGLIASSHTKNRLFKKWHKSRSLADETNYKSYRKIFKRVCTAAETQYCKGQFDTRINTSKQLWSNLNNMFSFKKGKSKTVLPNLKLGDKTVTNAEDICDGLNDYFCSVGQKLLDLLETKGTEDYTKYCPLPQSKSMFCDPVDPHEIFNIVMNFNNNKSPGFDNIRPKILKEICPEIAVPLTHIFNLSFTTGVVPDSLKLAKVIPVYKKGEKSEPGNYRPISLLSVFDKIMEKLMYKRLSNYLEKNKILYEFQFGFRKGHSTVFALMEVLDNIYQHLDQNEYVIGIYLDLQKAFDTVNHDILLYKMFNYGIRGVVHQWFKSYLCLRRQFTTIGDTVSQVGYVTTGVPQGSVLGPLLFLLYVNDICSAVRNTKIKLFADDTNLFLFDKNLDSLFCKANQSLQQLSEWFVANKLSLSLDKTCYSVFGSKITERQNMELKLNGTCIRIVESCKYLGLFIDSHLHWQDHIDYVYKKIIKFTSIFYKIRMKLNSTVLRLLYFAFIYPHLLYGIEIYGNTYNTYLNKLEKLNNKILRILQNKPIKTKVSDLYKNYDTLPLSLLHNCQILLFVHKFIHHKHILPEVFASYFTQNCIIYHHDTRSNSNIYIKSIHSTFGKRAIPYKGSILWNHLPNDLKILQSTSIFKSKLRNFLRENTVCSY